MAFSSNTSLDFSSSAGYSFDAAEFEITGGSGSLVTAETGPSVCITPPIDTTAWETMGRVEIDDTIEGTYRNKYLISFDGGTTWRRYREGVWIEAPLVSIASLGMTRWAVEDIRDWSPLGDALAFAVVASRTDADDDGGVSGFSVFYLSAPGSEQVTVPGTEPFEVPTDTLEADLGIQPDLPLVLQFVWPHDVQTMTGNYQVCVSLAETYRLMIDASFSGLDETQRDSVLAFIAAHYETPFLWESCPLHSDDPDAYPAFLFVQEPTVTQLGPDVWRVEARAVQAFYTVTVDRCVPSECNPEEMTYDLIDYEVGENEALTGGNCWACQWLDTGLLAWQIIATDLVEYSASSHDYLNGGTGWLDAWQDGGKLEYGVMADEDANRFTVGTGSAPYSGGFGLATPVIQNVEVVEIVSGDNGFKIDNGGIVWLVDDLIASDWQELRMVVLCSVPTDSAAGLGSTPRLRMGFCHGTANAPGIVAAGSVTKAIGIQSADATWGTYSTSGHFQSSASNSAQVFKIEAGTLSTANLGTLSRVGALNSSAAQVRTPHVVTLAKEAPNYRVRYARRTATSGTHDRTEGIARGALMAELPGTFLGTSHTETSATIAFDETGSKLNAVFVAFDREVWVSGVWVARIEA